MCKDYGMGVYIYRKGSMILLEESSYCDNPSLPKLYEEQKDSVSGTKGGGYVTPFSITKNKLIKHVKENGECSLISAVNSIDHHYSSKYSAKNNLHKMININVIKGVSVYQKGKETWIKPS